MEEKIDVPIYRKIALDVAGRIYRGEFREGDKIRGRSTLAGEYNVSPETIRRAMILLEDMEVLSVSKGSGIYIRSKQNAYNYIERFQSKETIGTLKNDMKKLIEQKNSIEEDIHKVLSKIIDYSDRLKNVNPITPVEVEVPKACHLIGRTISEVKFWQNTGGTIVGIRRKGKLIVSPGPYALFEEEDVILVVGDMGVYDRIQKYVEE